MSSKSPLQKLKTPSFLVKHRVGMWKDIRPELGEKAKNMEEINSQHGLKPSCRKEN